MPPTTRIHYRTTHGGPPNGGVPPERTRASALAALSGPPPPYFQPPTYTAHPVRIVEITTPSPQPCAPPPYVGYLPCSPLTPYAIPVMQVPLGFYPPPLPPPPPSQPPARPQPTEPPGATMDGAKIEFDDGMSTYIFPEDHAVIHFMNNEHQPWEHPYVEFGFTVHKVPCSMPIKELIRRLGCPGTYDPHRGIVECFETGNGAWIKGSTFRLHQDRSKQRLEDVGWTKSRGTDRKPVWLAVYKG
ncbi:hypothetical protein MMC26_006443 [Xylographa opegraphella]|nr:hypothetical protein [Xylographa opegraphella]